MSVVLLLSSLIVLCISVLYLMFDIIKKRHSDFQEQITKILSLLHYYDSISSKEGIERNKFLFVAFHLYLTNVIAPPKAQSVDIFKEFEIVENGKKKKTTFYHATLKLQPAIQHRIEVLPPNIKKDFLRRIYIDDNNVVHTEVHLLDNLRSWYHQIDFHSLKQQHFGNDIL